MQVLRPAVPLLAACALTAACSSLQPSPSSLPSLTPTEQFSIEVRSTPDEIMLAPHGSLSPAQESALADLADRWRDAGEGPILIQAAHGGHGMHTAHAAAETLRASGVPAAFVRVTPLDGAEGPPPPVRVGYSRLVAVGPQCANLWPDLTHTAANLPQSTFGCSVTANIAAQVADPRDLVAPRASYPADAVRRATVLAKYRQGEPTGAKRGDDERGDVSAAKK
ncbi:MAG TPA: CpaD family pilus assembly lipoprotein [Caulobacteraceae bacterium]|jgi:pilus assembly protein CpaD